MFYIPKLNEIYNFKRFLQQIIRRRDVKIRNPILKVCSQTEQNILIGNIRVEGAILNFFRTHDLTKNK